MQNMTMQELHLWRQYHAKRLLVTARTHEHAAALVARGISGGDFDDYLPKRDSGEPKQGATVMQAMVALGGTVVRR